MPLPGGLGIGHMPAGFGPFGSGTPNPVVEPTTTAVNCRYIDTTLQAYTTDANGNPPPMDGTASRVYLLCAYNDVRGPLITPQARSQRKLVLTNALRPLTTGLSPAISNLRIDVSQKADGQGILVTINYVNNLTSQPEQVIVK